GDALVVDLDLLARLEIVLNDHLAAAADERAPYLDLAEPVHVNTRDQFAAEEQVQIGDIFRLAGNLADAGGGNGNRPRVQHIVQDGQIMDRQIPQDGNVMLEQAQVHAHGIVIVDLAEFG